MRLLEILHKIGLVKLDASNGSYKVNFFRLAIVFLLIILIMSFIIFNLKSENKEFGVTSSKCQDLASIYDGKILKITSMDGLRGQIGIRVNKSDCSYEITWQSVFIAPQLEKNVSDAMSPVAAYSYVADVIFSKESDHPADGTISPVFANSEALPVDPFNVRIPFDYYSTREVIANTDKMAHSAAFSHVMQQTGTFSKSTIDEILQVKQIKIYKATPKRGSVNGDEAVLKGKPMARFGITIIE